MEMMTKRRKVQNNKKIRINLKQKRYKELSPQNQRNIALLKRTY
jgi:hypothetical protein